MKNLLISASNKQLFMLFILLLASPAQAEPTQIDVRVLSRGAKFIGTSMGGARITLRDADTGELLAEGKTRGGTGDTARIMKQAHKRNGILADESAAVFSATLDLQEPRGIEVTAYGPLAQRQAANKVTATQWILPGKDLTGNNGWLLEMPGFVVDILGPPAHQSLTGLPREITVNANVTKMCGCPLVPDGLWDADDYEVGALITRNGEPMPELPLEYAGDPSQFTGTLAVSRPGSYEITVYAYDPQTGNTGVDATTFNISPE